MDWAFCSVNGLGLNLWNFCWRKKKKKKLLEKSAAKSSEKISEIWKLREKMSKWTGLFCLFSADGLGLNLWKSEKKKLKNWKNYRSDAISEEKEGEKQGN